MKLTYDDKVQIYELRKQGYSLEKLSNKFGINNSNIRYMIKLIDRYGMEFVKKGKNRYYSPELKQEMIHKVLHENWPQDRVALEYALPNRGNDRFDKDRRYRNKDNKKPRNTSSEKQTGFVIRNKGDK